MTPDNDLWGLPLKPEHEVRAGTFVEEVNDLNQQYPDVRIKISNETRRILSDIDHIVEKIEKQGKITMFGPESLKSFLSEEEKRAAISTKVMVELESPDYGQVLDILAEIHQIASQARAKNIFGVDIEPQEPEDYDDLVETRKFGDENYYLGQRIFVFT
ncbi:hypothetical protein HYT59_01000 [Candidatus Woesebacteria bacterium]|nr:hypothetical protein [Candidatus Woesebacteria bacterium]